MHSPEEVRGTIKVQREWEALQVQDQRALYKCYFLRYLKKKAKYYGHEFMPFLFYVGDPLNLERR
jgi:hypothetical protein